MLCLLLIILMWVGYCLLFSNLLGYGLLVLWIVLGLPLAIISFVIFLFAIVLPTLILTKPHGEFKHWIARRLTRFIFIICRTRVRVVNKAAIVPKSLKPVVFVGNHKCQLDPFFAYIFLERPITVLSKATLRKIKILRIIFDSFGIIPINRESDREAAVSIAKAIKLNKSGVPFLFFPEGGIITREYEQCVTLKPGVYKLPQKSQATIQPFVIKGASKIKNRKWYKVSTVTVKFLSPIPYEDYKDLNTHEIGNKVNEMINSEFVNEKRVKIEVENK